MSRPTIPLNLNHGEFKLSFRAEGSKDKDWEIHLNDYGARVLQDAQVLPTKQVHVTFTEGKFQHSGLGYLADNKFIGAGKLRTCRS
jgi:hypothetical protein